MSIDPTVAQNALEKLLLATLVEQRRRRRWGIFFKLITMAIIVSFFVFLFVNQPMGQPQGNKNKPHIALIDINGVIDQKATANAQTVIESLDEAFKTKAVQGVILQINSPGGSPVQAALIFDEILRLRKLHHQIKVYAVCDDLCASAAYYIACACDKIYANRLSLVGSIGVIMEGFGFTDTLHKVGVERRLFTAGDRKAFLDPFSPINPMDASHVKQMLSLVHQQFIHDVMQGRGNRLKSNPDLFSGLIWTGLQALPLGLIDDFGSTQSILREQFKNENSVDYTVYPGYLETLTSQFRTFFEHPFTSEFLGTLNSGCRHMST